MSTETNLTERILAGDVRAAGRLMRWVDDGRPEARAALDALHPHTGRAYLIGVTGNPGSGKSTLVNQLIAHLRRRDLTVGCVAIDPTSPFSGGAILGDRVRMQQHALDRGVFIRSLATRGSLGGLSRSTPACVQILDAMGFDVVIIETVGVGQDEVDIVRLADTNLVVTVPGLGDDVQAEKAGVLEIADVFVINKAEQPGADRLVRELRTMLALREQAGSSDEGSWKPPLVKTVAVQDAGVDALVDTIFEHRAWLETHGSHSGRQKQRTEQFVRLLTQEAFTRRMSRLLASDDWQARLAAVVAFETTPHELADQLLAAVLGTQT